MDGTIRETLQAVLPESVIEPLAAKLGVVERTRKHEILKLVYSLVLSLKTRTGYGILNEVTHDCAAGIRTEPPHRGE